MRKLNINKLILNINNRLDELFKITYGSDVDENDESYKDVYKYELKEFFDYLRNGINSFIEAGKSIGTNELNSIIVLNWDFFNAELCDRALFDQFCIDLFIESMDDNKHKDIENNKELLNINDFDKDIIISSIKSNMDFCKTSLLSYKLKEDCFLTKLKEIDEPKFNSILESEIKNYINTMNILYKLNGYTPALTDLQLHTHIEEYYDINKNEFLFYAN